MVSFVVDLYSFSQNGLYLAYIIQSEKRLLIRNCSPSAENTGKKNQLDIQSVVKIVQKINLQATSSPVDSIIWSPDSQFIGAICKKYATVSIFSLTDNTWRCKLSLGTIDKNVGVGIENVWWSSDARHLLCLTQNSAYLAIYSIHEKFVQYLKNIATLPNSSTPRHSFSPNGSLVAVAHVDQDRTNFISLYCTKNWSKKQSFYLRSKDLAGICWGPDDYLAVWDSPLFSNLYVYQISTSSLVKQYSPHGMTCGFDTVQWSACGNFLVSTVQNKNELHVLNGLTFGTLIHDVLEPSSGDVVGPEGHCQLFYEIGGKNGVSKFKQVPKWPTSVIEQWNSCRLRVHASNWGRTTHVKLHSKLNYLACRTHLFPHIIWIYDLLKADAISILIYQCPVLDFDWHPNFVELAIISSLDSTSTSKSRSVHISLWMFGKGVKIYPSHQLRKMLTGCKSLKWNPLGNILLLQNEKFGMVHLLHIK